MDEQVASAESPRSSAPSATRRRVILAIVALMAISVVSYLLIGGGSEPPTEAVKPALTVAEVTPRRVNWPETIAAQGAILPWQEAIIGTQIGGYRLTEVRVNVGDTVKRGQVLARLDPALLRADEAQLAAQYEQARLNDQRAKSLQQVGGISEQEALRYATEAKTARALLEAKRLELRYTAILASDDGVISVRTATLGAVVPAGEELFRLIRDNRLEWQGELTAEQLARVAPGQPVTLDLPGGATATARVRQIAPKLNADTRVAIVYADILPGSRSRAEMFVSGTIAVGEATALVVPGEAVLIRDGRNYVMIIRGAGATPKIEQHEVEVGRRKGRAVEILSGLTGNERLVLRGGAFLRDGDTVRIATGRKAAP